MSLSAKAFFGTSCLIAVASIGGVHYSQIREREVSPSLTAPRRLPTASASSPCLSPPFPGR